MEKSIPISTDGRKFFRQYLELINPLIKLRGKELDVMSELLYYNDKFKDIPEEHRWKLIFDYDVKTEIREKLNLSDASLNNNLSALRKKGILVKNRILKSFLIYPDSTCKLSFIFTIH
jgi:DNA-binding MarR family transcriptional regulator